MEKQIFHVLDKIEQAGYEAYLVGGYVRDHLLKIKTSDIDICTNALPMDICKIFENYAFTTTNYGNVSLNINNLQIEITTYRKDFYKDSRRPKEVVYVSSLEEDLVRRDFTINAICMDKNGHVIDPLKARQDLKKHLIKMIGDPSIRLVEDPLRIMRAIRFATTLKFRLDEALKEAIYANRHHLKTLSYERKKEELTKIFASRNKAYGLKLLKSLKLDEELELFNLDNVLLTDDLIGMWSSICDTDKYPFTKNEKKIINEIKELINVPLDDNILYKYGIYPSMIACDLKKGNKRALLKRYDKLVIKDRNDIAITAKEICDLLHVEAGSLKSIYSDLEDVILRRVVKNDLKSIKKYLAIKYL